MGRSRVYRLVHDNELQKSRSGATYDISDMSSTEAVVGKQTAAQPLVNAPGGRYAAPRRNHWGSAPAQSSAGDHAGEARSVNAAAGRAPAMVQEQHAPAASQASAEPHASAAPSSANAASPTVVAAAGGPPLARVRAATAANDVAGLMHIVTELMPQLRANPSAPPPDVNEAITAARTWSMERIAAIRQRYQSQIDAASVRSASGHENRQGTNARNTRSNENSATAAVEAVETRLDAECTPYLDALVAGDPQHRYSHPTEAIREQVFAAVRLHISRGALARVGHADAEAEARDRANLHGDAAWCGAFAYTQARAHGGMDPHWASQMQGTGGIMSALNYGGVMAQTWIWIDGHWEALEAYHRRMGSPRLYETVDRGPPALGIHPGDIVLKDNNFGMQPDHITTALAFDGRFLTTVGGNEGIGHNRSDGVQRTSDDNAIDLFQNPTANDNRRIDPTTGHRIREVDRSITKHSRVHGIGRWSIADYERHVYSVSRTMPTAPPSNGQVSRALGDRPR